MAATGALVGRLGQVNGTPHHDDFAKAAAVTAADLMTKPPVVVTPYEPVANAARLMYHSRVKRLPVVGEGELVGIVSRTDVLSVYSRPDEDIRQRVIKNVILNSISFRPGPLHGHRLQRHRHPRGRPGDPRPAAGRSWPKPGTSRASSRCATASPIRKEGNPHALRIPVPQHGAGRLATGPDRRRRDRRRDCLLARRRLPGRPGTTGPRSRDGLAPSPALPQAPAAPEPESKPAQRSAAERAPTGGPPSGRPPRREAGCRWRYPASRPRHPGPPGIGRLTGRGPTYPGWRGLAYFDGQLVVPEGGSR